MAKVNDLLIVEMSSSQLSVASTDNKEYVLEGIFGEIDTKNKNNRIYTEDEYVPQIQQLQDKIKSSKLLGELDHPQQFDVSLKNVSHIVVECWWKGNDVMGKIKVLDTPSGRILKDLIKAGVKLGISSRGLGSVNEGYDGTITVNEDFQLICFDIVSEPSTPNAYVYPDEKRNMFGADTFKVKMKENKDNQIDDLFNKILRD